ncbi:hypothetical protein GJ744_004313 [Endocarpon pusillum]|uniref:D-xylulose reductase n=1 Tax=Endocarpon pusillum TaxID=364733 RepID=A0A8H7A8V5_9EURO|nr:hypothetical protein GJ744_004313 [Endocarpon pusillum]
MGSTVTETSTEKAEPVPDSSVSSPNSSSTKKEEDAQADACSCSTRAQNLSFVLEGVNKVKFEDRPIPEIKNPHDVLVQVKYTGICGSDVHYWSHGSIGPYALTSPMVLGHESSGTIIKVGSSVRTLEPGDSVAMEPGVPCRHCIRCKEGKYNLCFDMAFAATPPYDGTLAKYYVLPEDFCYKLPLGMSMEEGALIEPLAVAVHVTKQASIRHGDSVVVFGAGPVGLLCCAVARQFGASKIIAVDIQKPRLEFARQFAATATYESQRVSAQENAANLIRENNLGVGADVAIDASGAEPSVQAGIHVLRTGGTYVQGGMGKDDITFPIMAACTKELTVKGSFRYSSGDYKLAVELVSEGKVDAKRLISRKVRFEEAEQAFVDVKAGRGIKVLIGGSGD